jgi:aminopeptidase YwaD
MEQEALIAHLQEIVRDRNPFLAPQGHFYVREYLRQQFSQWGTVVSDTFEFRGGQHENLILDLPGTHTKPPILIAAHYDTVPNSPGADDNGTGLAVLLELARSLHQTPARYPIRLVAFDLEEIGLLGSRHYVEQHRGENLRLMLSLEMLGYCDHRPHSQRYPSGLERFYPNTGDFLGLIGNLRTIPDLLHLSRMIQRGGAIPCQWLPAGQRGMIVPDTRRSDHAPFWDAGYRAVLVTDTADLRNPHYHSERDRLDTLDLDFLAGVAQGLLHAIETLP